MHYYK